MNDRTALSSLELDPTFLYVVAYCQRRAHVRRTPHVGHHILLPPLHRVSDVCTMMQCSRVPRARAGERKIVFDSGQRTRDTHGHTLPKAENMRNIQNVDGVTDNHAHAIDPVQFPPGSVAATKAIDLLGSSRCSGLPLIHKPTYVEQLRAAREPLSSGLPHWWVPRARERGAGGGRRFVRPAPRSRSRCRAWAH